MMSILLVTLEYFNSGHNYGHFLSNLLKVDIAIMMYDRILHLATVVAMVMTVWARNTMIHCAFSAWLHHLQRGRMCIWLRTASQAPLLSSELPVGGGEVSEVRSCLVKNFLHVKGRVIYFPKTQSARKFDFIS